MQNLLTIVLTLGVPVVGLLIAYRVWTYAAASGNKSPGKVISGMVTVLIVFAAGMVVIPKALNWGSSMFMSQLMQNPGVQSGISLMGTGAGLIDQTLSVPSGAAPQIQVPQIQLPQQIAPQPQGYVVPQAPAANQQLQSYVQQAIQSSQPAGSQQVLPQVAPQQNAITEIQAQAVATGQAIMDYVNNAVQSTTQSDAQAIQDFSFNTYLATATPAPDCLTGAQQGPQLPHCVGVDRTGEAEQVWAQQQQDIADYAQETEQNRLNGFSFSNEANELATRQAVQAYNAQVSQQATTQAYNAQVSANATAVAYDAWVAAVAEQTRVAHENYLNTLSLTAPTATPQAPVVYQANDPAIPADCLTGDQQGPQLPHCMGVDRSNSSESGSVWAMTGQ
ncbi:MAG: hypothetical protein AAF702_42820 [Chloroflexota bacterium]